MLSGAKLRARAQLPHQIRICSFGALENLGHVKACELPVFHDDLAVNNNRSDVARFRAMHELAKDIIDGLVVEGFQFD